MPRLKHFLATLPYLLLAPLLVLIAAVVLALTDLCWVIFGRRRLVPNTAPRKNAASVVIPNWNGRELLAKYLPSVVAALDGNPENEIIVVDNGSEDGSAEFLRQNFPQVRVLALPRNLGFGGGSNAGFRAARNDIVVLLNSDMRVEPDFLAPLLEAFTDDAVFCAGCQIFFSDPARRREETGLTQGWWRDGRLRVTHRIDEAVTDVFPCFYGGGGSCAFDRRKFLELGGFDPLLAPFYLEDTDLGYMAWKRGWRVLYQPRSVVYHEHRGTIGKHFRSEHIQAVYKKNYVLFCWKNIHEWRRLAAHFVFALGDAAVSAVFGDSPERGSARGLWRAFLQLPQAVVSRWRARSLAAIDDTEAFRRPLGGYYRDRFLVRAGEAAEKPLRVLFVSPYPICPPTHGGGVFMYNTVRELARLAEVHLVCMLDYARELPAHAELASICASAKFLVRAEGKPASLGSVLPYAVREFASEDLAWLIHRQIYMHGIDVVQLDYTVLAQYAGRYKHIVCALFEHDIYFQSIARGLREPRGLSWKLSAAIEYLRALRYELRTLPKMDLIQVCTRENREYLLSFLPGIASRTQDGLRAGVDTSRYEFRADGREPETMLFLGSFRHLPNQLALNWFIRAVLPLVLEQRPGARLVVVGSEPPPRHRLPPSHAIELRGFVEDTREPLSRYAVFVCPVLSGSGVRVKLLEAFAAGIPAVSTRLGAEGLARKDGEFCALADDPAEFARKILELFDNPAAAAQMALRARKEVEENWDAAAITRKLVASYHEALAHKRGRAAKAAAAPVA
ncbi:MAG TPA: glycosyltransferase [Bryobacteraceae bacterium]|nr:glycosyltransferase [Bryobacteraceae bacterium]